MNVEEDALPSATILLVDDEDNVLTSLRRAFRVTGHRILMARDGEQALAMFKVDEDEIDLVISDARMPNMDGIELLATVQQRWPLCMRILLTGGNDLRTSIRAVNEGKVYRYLTKPWDTDELLSCVQQALQYRFAERERARLEQLAIEQNAQLKQFNTALEQRVAARTLELQQIADMLDVAYADLRRSYAVATEVFSSLLNQRLPASRQTNRRVVELVKSYAREAGLCEAARRDLAMAAALYNLGKISWPDALLNQPAEAFDEKARAQYRRYPEVGETLLMTLEPLHDAGALIRGHQECWDGTGFPDGLRGERIPFGARLLRLAVDFIELQQGMIVPNALDHEAALAFLRAHANTRYDPALCALFVDFCAARGGSAAGDKNVLMLKTDELRPGMVVAKDLHATNGTLLLSEGKELSGSLIRRLLNYESVEETAYTLFVRAGTGVSAA